MRTPKEYLASIKEGIITADIFADCIFSVNKRAKNYRDNAREQRAEYGRYAFTNSNDNMKAKYYAEKEFFLQFLRPSAIHKEFAGYERQRIYDYQGKLYKKNIGNFIWENCYYDRDLGYEVWFGDIEKKDHPKYRHYLYYELGSHSFHSPCTEDIQETYPNLPVKELDELLTQGADTNILLSTQFVNKVMLCLCSGKYKLDFSEHADPLPVITEIPGFVTVPTTKEAKNTLTEAFVPPREEITTINRFGEEQSAYEYISRYAHYNIGKPESLAEAEKLGMKVTSKTRMSDALDFIEKNGDLISFASKHGCGVEKSQYIESGMTESQYRKLSKKMHVVGSREWNNRLHTKVNVYDLKQYLRWRNTGIIS